MMFGWFSRNRERELRELISSFRDAIAPESINDFVDYIDHREPELALEFLSTWIYEHDVPVSSDQETEIIRLSDSYGIDRVSHPFVGRKPPYPDLRTPEQLAEQERLTELERQPTLSSVRDLARNDRRVLAVKVYRKPTGSSLDEAVAAVDRLASE